VGEALAPGGRQAAARENAMMPWTSIERLVRKLADSEHAHATAVDARVSELSQRVARQPTAKDLRELRQAVRALAPADDRQILEELGRIAASGKPIVVGPWTGELGFELLYWIPFVEWVRAHWNIGAERQIVVSRGGVAPWYGSGDSQYDDAFATVTPEEFRIAVTEQKRKQRQVTAFDQRLVAGVVDRRRLGEIELLHPRLMFRLFAPFWNDEAGYSRIDQFTRYRLLDAPHDAMPRPLPSDYVAVRIYFSECFPDTPANRAFAHAVVSAMAERTPVVLLNPGFSVDEHEDWAPSVRDRIHTIAEGISPERNLAVQSAVISGARAFVGTYGGYSYLAPLCRVPAVAFYSRATFKRHHLYAAQRAFDQLGAAALTLVDATQAPFVGSVTGRL
jgi:hypothetical protein